MTEGAPRLSREDRERIRERYEGARIGGVFNTEDGRTVWYDDLPRLLSTCDELERENERLETEKGRLGRALFSFALDSISIKQAEEYVQRMAEGKENP